MHYQPPWTLNTLLIDKYINSATELLKKHYTLSADDLEQLLSNISETIEELNRLNREV